MNVRDWLGFLKQGAGKEIAIAQLPKAIARHLGATSNFVYLHHAYAVKAVDKHQITPEQFPLIFDTIEFGIPIADRALHVTFVWNGGKQGWFQVTVKRAFESRRVYVATFYKTTAAKVASKLKRYPAFQQ
jgi:hypothetical protein